MTRPRLDQNRDLPNFKQTLNHFTLLYIYSAVENIGVHIQIKLFAIFRFAFSNLYKTNELPKVTPFRDVFYLLFCASFVTLFRAVLSHVLNLLVSLHEEVKSILILYIISLSHTLNADLWAFSSLLRHYFQLSVKKVIGL